MKLAKILVCLLAVFSYYFTYAQIPDHQNSGNIPFVSGGIGDDEAEAMLIEAKKWPLLLQFSLVDQKGWGSWVSGVKVKIFDAKKVEILNIVSDGPFVLLELKPGLYLIDASYDGVAQQKNIVIKQGQSDRLSIYWR